MFWAKSFIYKYTILFLRLKFLQEFLNINLNGAENKHAKEIQQNKSEGLKLLPAFMVVG